MQHGQASRTALGAAGHRAAHQVLERGIAFSDPLALAILGQDADDAITLAKEEPERRPLRLFIAMRSRFAEDSARRAVHEGVRQILVLGAGLDTFAYRLQPTEGLRVFELDHPATQRDKRRRLADAQISAPEHVAYVAHDFEHGSTTAALEARGFDAGKRTFVLWLGVTPYLTEDAVFATLGELARLPGGAAVVFDYANPRTQLRRRGRATFIGRWLSGSRRAASRSDATSIRLSCTLARIASASPNRGSRSSGAGRTLSSELAHRPPARARGTCRADGDGIDKRATRPGRGLGPLGRA
jgi:methyltransferase (TIGR00027 family)